jgi:hypothetical protein
MMCQTCVENLTAKGNYTMPITILKTEPEQKCSVCKRKRELANVDFGDDKPPRDVCWSCLQSLTPMFLENADAAAQRS